ncbi:ricin B lectin domain-containing protein [Obelidium mucronatum]|nr:ricin B lectin domain-containing protein [Obelidium mucronatum]
MIKAVITILVLASSIMAAVSGPIKTRGRFNRGCRPLWYPPFFDCNWPWEDLCVDVENSGTASYSKVIAWECNGGGNQIWAWHPTLRGSIYNPRSGKCLDSGGNQSGDNSVQLFDCFRFSNGRNAAQEWELVGTQLRSKGKCLNVQGMDAGKQLILWDCNNDENEKFWLRF